MLQLKFKYYKQKLYLSVMMKTYTGNTIQQHTCVEGQSQDFQAAWALKPV